MKTMQFRCKLLSDVILNVKAATEGNQNTLDFIPGNNFLGIVATNYDNFSDQQKLDLFHNGTVRYGDAHPVSKESVTRSLRIPASMHYPKLKSINETCYIHHAYERALDHEGECGGPQQLKQSREGFYEFSSSEGVAVETPKSFAIKSAYDRSQRRAQDTKMFGYESLRKGAEFFFEVETDRDEYAQLIIDHLVGKHQIGRSRTAQYGLVEITVADFSQPGSTDHFFMHHGQKHVVVYADSRLIFLDENGELTFQPKAKDLWLEGKIVYDLSQVRTFQYAPWNYKRQTRDADRCGIEKGSVFVVEVPDGYKMDGTGSRYVGSFNNEGFGHVIYNPSFLDVKPDTNGKSAITINKAEDTKESEKNQSGQEPKLALDGSPLLKFIGAKKKESDVTNRIYGLVNEFVDRNKDKFHGQQFASQWGAIRSIATKATDYDDLWKKLISNQIDYPREPTISDDRTVVTREWAYLGHGVAADKWKKGNRKAALEKFIKMIHQEFNDSDGKIAIMAVVNLASEMAKICK